MTTMWRRRAYPAMFALFPIVAVAANNPGYYRLVDVVVLSLIALVGVVALYSAVYAVLRALVRSAEIGDMAAFATLVAIALFYSYGPLPLGDLKRWVAEHRIDSVLGIALVAATVYLARRKGLHHRMPSPATVGAFLTLTGTILLAVSLGRLGFYEISDLVAIHRSKLVQNLALPVPVRAAAAAAFAHDADGARVPKRDIYLLVLDEYAATDVYRERFGYDNRPFEDSLRALGFRIPRQLRSNYANTLLSITSLLNFDHVRPLADVMSPNSRDFSPAAYLMEHNRTVRFLKSEEYKFVFFPSSWYAPTRSNRDADEVFDADVPFDLGREIHRSWLAQYFATTTLLSKLMPRLSTPNEVDTDHAMRTFAGIPSVAHDPRLTFAFAHVLMPHLGFKIDASCAPLVRSKGDSSLAGELECLNSRTLTMVHSLLETSSVAPIIIIQGDHGSQSLKQFDNDTALPTVEQSRERFRPFGAYYLPDGGDAAIPDSTSIVNVFRYVLSYYFNADLEPAPNTMYYSHWRYPYRMTEVDANFHVLRRRPRDGHVPVE